MPIFDLNLRGPLHQGQFVGINREAVLEWVPADTLLAALITIWAGQGADIAGRLAGDAAGSAPLRLSSALPRAGAVRFYPAPPRLPGHSGLFAPGGSGKLAKKVRWLSQGVLDALRTGQTPAVTDDCFLHERSLWLTPAERQAVAGLLTVDDEGHFRLWKRQVVPHVAIDRLNNAPNLFHTGRVTFAPGAGLWFAVRGRVEWVREALPDLADSGLGGLRSTGHGAFDWMEAQTPDLAEPATGWGLCLSRYAPADAAEMLAALQAPESAYRFTTVGGWCEDDEGHPWRRRSVRLLAEGALLPAGTRGQLVDVRPLKPEDWLGPQRPVYRSGLAFLVAAGQLAEAA